MRKKLKILLLLLIVFWSCRKEPYTDKQATNVDGRRDSLTVAEIRSWITAHKSSAKPHTAGKAGQFDIANLGLPWDSVYSGRSNNRGNYLYAAIAGSATFRQVKQGYRKILFTKGSRGISAYVLEVIPDAMSYQRNGTIDPRKFTGRVFIYTKEYQLMGGYVYIGGKVSGSIRPEKVAALEARSANPKLAYIPAGGGGSVSCEWMQSYYVNSEGDLVIYAEKVCTIDLTDLSQDMPADLPPIDQSPPDYTQGGGGAGAPAVSNLPGESNAKINPKSYTNCFGNIPDAGATMKVTVFVQEPWPGTTFNLGSNSVGHVAIGLTKTNGSQTITQVIGFYPNATGATKMHAPSKLVDNGGFDYNVSITYNVNAQNFNAMLNYIGNPPATYDITDFNCTNFAISACQAGGITLPDATNTVGLSGPGGAMTAMTPAGLGNSIEKMNGSNINKNGGTMPASTGPCN